MTHIITVVPPALVPIIQERILHHFRDAARWTEGRFLPEDFYARLVDGSSTCVIAVEEGTDEIHAAACITSARYPQQIDLLIEYIGGEKINLWGKTMLQYLKDLAASTGHSSLVYTGREGWIRAMGFDPKGVFAEIRLNVERSQPTSS